MKMSVNAFYFKRKIHYVVFGPNFELFIHLSFRYIQQQRSLFNENTKPKYDMITTIKTTGKSFHVYLFGRDLFLFISIFLFFPGGSFLLFQNIIINNYMLTNMKICRIFHLNYKMERRKIQPDCWNGTFGCKRLLFYIFESYNPLLHS